jgi:hypothetical protein
MAKSNARIEAVRKAYREALEAARTSPGPEAWARLLAAGKELSRAEEPPPRSRRGRRGAPAAEDVARAEREAPAPKQSLD